VTYIREDMADIRLWVDNVPFGDSWRTQEGGLLEADDAKTRPGGMGYEVSAGGPASRNDLTITTQHTETTAAFHPTLESKVGHGRARVRINWLHGDRTPTGFGRTAQGTIKSAGPGDQGDGNGVVMYTVVVSCDELAAA
jgi:hypothetical protein